MFFEGSFEGSVQGGFFVFFLGVPFVQGFFMQVTVNGAFFTGFCLGRQAMARIWRDGQKKHCPLAQESV